MGSTLGLTATNFTAQDVKELIKQAGITLPYTSFSLFKENFPDSVSGFFQEVM